MTKYKIYYNIGGSNTQSASDDEMLKITSTQEMIQLVKERFNDEFEEIIGGGGNGVVLKVKDSKDNQIKAYKITRSELNGEVEEAIISLQDTPYGFGLTKLYEVYRFKPWRFTMLNQLVQLMTNEEKKEENKKFAKYLFFQPNYTEEEMNALIQEDEGIKKVYEHWMAKEYRQEESKVTWNAQIMELLDGDLEKLGNTGKEPTHFDDMFICVIRNILELVFGIDCRDSHKANNIFVKKISEGEEINGVNLLNYDFWKLRLGGEDYYFPSQNYIIKLGDYDEWHKNYDIKQLYYTHNRKSMRYIFKFTNQEVVDNIENMLNLPLVNSIYSKTDDAFEVIDGNLKLTKTIKWFGLEMKDYDEYKEIPDTSKTVFSFF